LILRIEQASEIYSIWMTNFLKVSVRDTIYSLSDRGWSRRRIARELGVDRETVGRYLELRAKPAIPTTGKGAGRKSQCEPLGEVISAKIEAGLSAQQDLVNENGFTDSYESVKRFVRKLRGRQPERVWRMEVQPGEEVQVDFGVGAPIEGSGARPRDSTHVCLPRPSAKARYPSNLIS
jgi:transposase